MRWRATMVVAAVALLMAAARVDASEPTWGGRRPAILTLVINEVQYGDALVLLAGGDALVEARDLRRAGVSIVGAHTETLRDRSFVSLRSLGIAFVTDEPGMSVRLMVSTDLLATTQIDLGRGGAPPDLTYPEQTSAFVNYAVHMARDTDLDRASATHIDGFGEAGLRLGGALAHSTVTLSNARAPVRGASNITWDDRDDLRRVIAGDHQISGGGLGGSAFVGGLHLTRGFDLDPYLTTAPAVDLRGMVPVPSTAEIYVDGALVRRIELPPGRYDLSNLPASAGAGTTRVVIRDPLGRSREMGSSFYLPSGLLRRGLSDYALSLGLRREELATASFDYGEPVGLGRYRLGLGHHMTAGVRAEGSASLVSGGVTLGAGSPLGQFELGAAASADRGGSGAAGSLAWSYLGRRGGGSMVLRVLSPRYATLDVGPAAARALVESRLTLTRSLGRRIGLAAQVAGDRHRDDVWNASSSVTASFAAAHGWTLSTSVGASHDDLAGRSVHALASLSFAVTDRTRGAISHEQRGAQGRDRLDLHRSIAGGVGVGYRLAAQLGDRDTAAAEIVAESRLGRYQAGYLQTARGGRADVSAAGGVAIVGGRILATRAIERSFVLVRVPDAKGVRVYLDNKEVGRTDARGDLLVSGALPHYGNRLAIEPADLPEDRPPQWTSVLVAPPDRAGVVVGFAAPRLNVVRGSLRIERGGRQFVPAYGELQVGAAPDLDDPESEQRTSPLGGDGEFEIDGLSPGGYPAVIEWDGGRCELGLDVPASPHAIVNLGVQVCHVPTLEAPR